MSALPPAPGHVHRLGSSQQLGLRPTLGQMQRSDLWLEMLILRSRLELPHCGGYLMAQSWPLPNQPCLTPLPLSRQEFDSSASYTKIWNKLSFSLSTFAFGERHPNKTCECSKLAKIFRSFFNLQGSPVLKMCKVASSINCSTATTFENTALRTEQLHIVWPRWTSGSFIYVPRVFRVCSQCVTIWNRYLSPRNPYKD